MADNKVWTAVKPYLNGGASGMMATCIIQPIDMVKVRLQLGATGGPVSCHDWSRYPRLSCWQLCSVIQACAWRR